MIYEEVFKALLSASTVSTAWEKLMLDAAAAIEALEREVEDLTDANRWLKEGRSEDLNLLPNRGEWIRKDAELYYWHECSKCGERPLYDRYANKVLSAYCPNCGAKMNDSNASNALDNAQDGPIVTPCRGCSDYDGYGGCKSKGGCARAKTEVQDEA